MARIILVCPLRVLTFLFISIRVILFFFDPFSAPTTTLEPKPVITRPNLDDMFLRQIEMIRSKNDPSEGPPGVELERVGGPVGVVVQKEELSVEEAYSGLSYNSNPVLPKETVTNSVDPS